jgi:hypothetical protein
LRRTRLPAGSALVGGAPGCRRASDLVGGIDAHWDAIGAGVSLGTCQRHQHVDLRYGDP